MSRFQEAKTRRHNDRVERDIARGRESRMAPLRRQMKSRTPGYRKRINPGTGRPHRDDAKLGRGNNEQFARLKKMREESREWSRRGRPADHERRPRTPGQRPERSRSR